MSEQDAYPHVASSSHEHGARRPNQTVATPRPAPASRLLEDPRTVERLMRSEGRGRVLAIRALILFVLFLAAQAYDGSLHEKSHWIILGIYAAGSVWFGIAERHGGRWADAMAWTGTGFNACIAVYVVIEHMLAVGGTGADAVSRLPAFLLLLQAGLTIRRGHVLLFSGLVTGAWCVAFAVGLLHPQLFPGPDADPTAQMVGLASFIAAALVVIDGVSRLRAAVDRALRIERERTALARFLPDAVALDLAADDAPGVHRRHACLMVLDIRGFSRLSREQPPEAMVKALLGVRAAAQAVVAENGGLVDKYVGDAVLVQFVVGAPDAQARAALACARAIRDRIAALNAARSAAGLFTLRVVVALHAGDLLVGVFDDGVRAEYTVLGPAMNALSRIEARAKAADLEIAASGDFLGLVGGALPDGFRAVAAAEVSPAAQPALFAIDVG